MTNSSRNAYHDNNNYDYRASDDEWTDDENTTNTPPVKRKRIGEVRVIWTIV
jgi:hypothetical protein